MPALALAAAGVLAGCSGHASVGGSETPIAVNAAPVQSRAFTSRVELAGSLTATHSVTLGAISAGRIVSVPVRVGDRVTAGQVIAQVDTSGYAAAFTQARAAAAAAAANEQAGSSSAAGAQSAISAARAQFAAAQSHLQLAQVTAERMSSLYAQGAISKQQNDEAQATLAAARAAAQQAQAGLAGSASAYQAAVAQSRAAAEMAAQAQAGVAAASVPLNEATLTAPFDGVVTSKFVQPGAVVGPGSPVAAIENTHDLELDVAVSNADLAGLTIGQSVAVHVDAAGASAYPGRIRAIVPSENPALRSATVIVSLAPEPGLVPGMYARVRLPGSAHSGTAVPLAALVTRAGQSGVFEVRAGKAVFVPVQTGDIEGGMIEVRGPGLAGRQVVVDHLELLTDGASITVQR